MAGAESFEERCERCGKLVFYEDMEFICESYVCKECYEKLHPRTIEQFFPIEIADEDDGYCD